PPNEEGSIRRAGATEDRHRRGRARRIDPCWTEPLGGAGMASPPLGFACSARPPPRADSTAHHRHAASAGLPPLPPHPPPTGAAVGLCRPPLCLRCASCPPRRHPTQRARPTRCPGRGGRPATGCPPGTLTSCPPARRPRRTVAAPASPPPPPAPRRRPGPPVALPRLPPAAPPPPPLA